MEFLDEDARPRFVLQSKPLNQAMQNDPQVQTLHKPALFVSISLSVLFLTLSFLYFTSEPFSSLLIWLSVSLLVGPFAPASVTAGDIRVGLGPPIEEPVKEIERSDDSSKKISRKASKFNRKPDEPSPGSELPGSGQSGTGVNRNGFSVIGNGSLVKSERSQGIAANEQADWAEGEEELLKKLMGKHPVGKPGRWEAIAEGFKGRHNVESVIKRSKEMGEKKVSDGDSYNRFLKDRKAVDKRIEGGNDTNIVGATENAEVKGEASRWTAGEDLALLNALKAFPKDVAMRWEKIAAAVPGKTVATCMRRVTELKKDFRSSKAAAGKA